MRLSPRKNGLQILLSLMAVLLFIVGCTSPTKQVYTAELTFNGIGHEVITLSDQKVLVGAPYSAVADVLTPIPNLFPGLEQAAKDAEAAGPLDTIQQHYHFDQLIGVVNKAIDDATNRLLASKNAQK